MKPFNVATQVVVFLLMGAVLFASIQTVVRESEARTLRKLDDLGKLTYYEHEPFYYWEEYRGHYMAGTLVLVLLLELVFAWHAGVIWSMLTVHTVFALILFWSWFLVAPYMRPKGPGFLILLGSGLFAVQALVDAHRIWWSS